MNTASASRHPCRQSPRVQTMARFLFEDQPLRASFHKRLRHSGLDPRNRLIDHLLGVRARHTGVLGGAMRHRERIRARLDHPFDSTPVGFAFSTRRLQQSLKIAERRKIGPARLLDRLQKRLHEPAFQRVRHAGPSRAPPARPSRSLRRDRSCDALPASLPRADASQERPPSPLPRPRRSPARPGRLGPDFRQPARRNFGPPLSEVHVPPLATRSPVEQRQAFFHPPRLAVHSIGEAGAPDP